MNLFYKNLQLFEMVFMVEGVLIFLLLMIKLANHRLNSKDRLLKTFQIIESLILQSVTTFVFIFMTWQINTFFIDPEVNLQFTEKQ